MRHNQNGRRFRGRNNGKNNNRRSNPKTQTFDSNGPEVRIRGNASQICEKYLTLAKDARGAGDRVLAESYLQHAEHYQRLINDMVAQQERINEQRRAEQEQKSDDNNDENLNDLDQEFLVGDRKTSGEEEGADAKPEKKSATRSRKPSRKTAKATEEVAAV